MISELFHHIKSKILSLEPPYKIYLFAMVLFSLSMILSLISFGRTSLFIFLISYILFGIAFAHLIWPVLRKSWDQPFGKCVIPILNLIFLIASAALARELVSAALELPPQDFDLTVNFITLLMYIPICTAAAAIILIGYFVLLLLFSLIVSISNEPFIDYGLNKLSDILKNFRFSMYLSSGKRCQFAWKGFCHALGAVALGSALFVPIAYYLIYKDKLHVLVRYVAFLADFKPANRYPDVTANERIRLHENGIISSATMSNGKIQIHVRKMKNNE